MTTHDEILRRAHRMLFERFRADIKRVATMTEEEMIAEIIKPVDHAAEAMTMYELARADLEFEKAQKP